MIDIVNCYKEGFAPGPCESFFDFENRVLEIKEGMKDPKAFLKTLQIPYQTLEPITSYFLSFTTKKGLPFWFGAMTWMAEYKGYTIPLLELPKKTYFFSPKRSELLAHEYIHFLRSSFSESRFEEVLAYKTSPSPLRKFLGPLFQRPFESYLFLIGALLFPFFTPPFLLLTTFFALRLSYNQWVFQKALKHLAKTYQNPLELITLFTDNEIAKTAKGTLPFFDPTLPRSLLIKKIALTK